MRNREVIGFFDKLTKVKKTTWLKKQKQPPNIFFSYASKNFAIQYKIGGENQTFSPPILLYITNQQTNVA